MDAVSGVRAAPHLLGRGIDLEWQNPPVGEGAAALLAGVRVVRRERTFPLDADDGAVAYDGPVVSRFSDRGLKPLTTYYYTVFAKSTAGGFHADERSRVAAFSTDDYGLAERLYNLLPAVHLRRDKLSPAELEQLEKLLPGVLARLAALPAGLRGGGPLRRFLHAAAAPLSAMRSTAEGLRRLYDLDQTPPQFLLSLAHWVGWESDRTLPVYAQRNEVRFAPALYRSTGTAPNLRALVTRYSGWDCRVAELEQSIARSNSTPRLNVCAVAQRDGEWRGADDAAPVLGFGAANSEARGEGADPAKLTGNKPELFALRHGMELTVGVDGRLPVTVRFQQGDFYDISKAKAAEVAAVVNRLLGDVTARTETSAGATRLVLESNSKGANSSLRVETDEAALVSLEGSPSGRLSPCLDQTPTTATRVRLFYETSDPLARSREHAALRALSDEAAPPAGAQPGDGVVWDAPKPLGRLRYKTYRAGRWGESLPVSLGDKAQGSPAAVQLTRLANGNKRIFLAWVENPHTDTARLRYAVGVTSLPRRARLVGHRNQPFVVEPGTNLFFRGNWPEPLTFRFAETDFVNPRNVTAEQLVSVIRARTNPARLSVEALPNGSVAFGSAAYGGDERLELDLGLSSAAASLGFDERNASAAGDWGDEIDWADTKYVPTVGTGRHADLSAAIGWDGNVWLFWATHSDGLWRIMHTRWDGTNWTTPQTLASGQGGNREPCAALNHLNYLWLFWSRRDETRPGEDVWTLRYRVCISGSWGSEVAFTAPPDGGRSADREPYPVKMSDNTLRVFFRSDRAGGPDLWQAQAGAGAATPTPLLSAAPAEHAPAPLIFPDNVLWLFFRSDRSFSPSRLLSKPLPPRQNRVTSPAAAAAPPPSAAARSFQVGDAGTLRRHAGTTSVVLNDIARSKRRRLWDDLIAYTAQSPRGEPLGRDDLYTRGTVGLYLSEAVEDSPLSRQTIERLRALLDQFLPINARAVVVLSPRIDKEFVYDDENVLGEVLLPDKYPAAEFYDGPAELEGAPPPKLPGWQVFKSNRADHVTAVLKPEGSATWKLRTFYPPPK